MVYTRDVALPAVSAEYPVCWVEVPYANEPQCEAQAPTIAYEARGAREAARRAQSVTALAEELDAARIGDTSAMGCNYSALYMDKWREDHTLFVSDYGTGGVGNWVLLEGTPPLIMDFKAGKYMVKIDGADVWFRAENLIEYSGESLAAARQVKKAAAVEASQQAVEAELDTGGHVINARVFAKGLAPDGEVAWFIAQVIGHRPLKYPPCVRDLQTQTTVEPTMGLLIPGPCVFTGSRSSTSPRGTERRRRWCSRSLAPALCPHRTCKLKSRSDESSRRVHSAPITHRNRDSQRDLRHR